MEDVERSSSFTHLTCAAHSVRSFASLSGRSLKCLSAIVYFGVIGTLLSLNMISALVTEVSSRISSPHSPLNRPFKLYVPLLESEYAS